MTSLDFPYFQELAVEETFQAENTRLAAAGEIPLAAVGTLLELVGDIPLVAAVAAFLLGSLGDSPDGTLALWGWLDFAEAAGCLYYWTTTKKN